MTEPKIDVVDDLGAFAKTAAQAFVDAAREAIAARGQFVVALTGGTTPKPLHEALAKPPFRDQVEWPKVIVFFGDDRAVPPSDPRSNFRSAEADLLSKVPAQVHRIVGEAPDLPAQAKAYQAALVAACGGTLDLLFVGIGKDGHILSLHPNAPQIDERSALVVAILEPPMDPPVSRVSMTPVVVERARSVLALATGEGKRDALRKALDDPDDPKRVPAHVLRRARSLRWIVDRAARG